MNTIDVADSAWLDAQRRVAQADLARMSGISAGELEALVKHGGLVPLPPAHGSAGRHFSAAWVAPLRHAASLRATHDLDLFTTSLLLGYLHKIAQLEQQLRAFQAHPPQPVQLPREGPTPWREPHA
jgi:chaperone modulatory protein CbpM